MPASGVPKSLWTTYHFSRFPPEKKGAVNATGEPVVRSGPKPHAEPEHGSVWDSHSGYNWTDRAVNDPSGKPAADRPADGNRLNQYPVHRTVGVKRLIDGSFTALCYHTISSPRNALPPVTAAGANVDDGAGC